MTKAFMFLLLLVGMPLSLSGQTSCECVSFIPDSNTMWITVSSVAELDNALHVCQTNGGDCTIFIEPGEYHLSRNLLFISEEMSNLTIIGKGAPSEVRLEGDGMNGSVTHIFNVAADHFRLENVTVAQVAHHAIQIHGNYDADSCVIQNVIFEDINEQMLKVSSDGSERYSDGGIVQCCHFEFTAGIGNQYYTGGIDAHQERDWKVLNNSFYHIRSPESQLAEHAIHFWSDSEKILIENNHIVNCDRGIGLGLGNRGHGEATIRNNFVHTSRDVGIGLESAVGVDVHNNTVDTENYQNSIEYRFMVSTDISIHSNLTNGLIRQRDGATASVFLNFQYMDSEIFVDPDAHDYHLADYHPEIVNQGEVSYIISDIDCDPIQPRNDIGADEWMDVTTDVEESIPEEVLTLSPNPSFGISTLRVNADGLLTIFSASGMLIMKREVRDATEVEVHLPPGLSFIKWEDRESTRTLKVVSK